MENNERHKRNEEILRNDYNSKNALVETDLNVMKHCKERMDYYKLSNPLLEIQIKIMSDALKLQRSKKGWNMYLEIVSEKLIKNKIKE